MLPAGIEWCQKFPGSRSLDDLAQPFQDNCRTFIARLIADGATVSIAATYRPPERAYLLHYACLIAGDGCERMPPDAVPPMAGVDIQWDLGTPELSIAAAEAMVRGYGIAYPAALVSQHTRRLAIDMSIVGHPLSGQALWDLGKTYGIIKLVSDGPHWSNNGH